tara:strand:+ start:283 stop:534 length:252 start_codon:yes stop_codon:yes gene_type:complete
MMNRVGILLFLGLSVGCADEVTFEDCVAKDEQKFNTCTEDATEDYDSCVSACDTDSCTEDCEAEYDSELEACLDASIDRMEEC